MWYRSKKIDSRLGDALKKMSNGERLDVMVQVENGDWAVPAGVREEVKEGTRMGDVLRLSLTVRALKRLVDDPAVLLVE